MTRTMQLLLAGLLLAPASNNARASGSTEPGVARQMHFPRKQWEIVRPEAEGFDAHKLAEAVSYLKKNAGRDGVEEFRVVCRGRVVWHGHDIDTVHGVWSCTKSFT